MTRRKRPTMPLDVLREEIRRREGPLSRSIRVRADGVSVTPQPPRPKPVHQHQPEPFPVILDDDLPPGFDPDARGDDMPTGEGLPVWGTPPASPPPVTFPEGMTLDEAVAALAHVRDAGTATADGHVGPRTAHVIQRALLRGSPDGATPEARMVAVDAAARIIAATADGRTIKSELGRQTVSIARVLTRYIVTGEEA